MRIFVIYKIIHIIIFFNELFANIKKYTNFAPNFQAIITIVCQ